MSIRDVIRPALMLHRTCRFPTDHLLPTTRSPMRRKRFLTWSGRFELVGFGMHLCTRCSQCDSRAQGRAIYILENTLPDFFQVGLVANVDPTRPDIVDVPVSESGSVESIYSRNVRLMYTPPVALPPPFPRTLSLEGEYSCASGVVSL
ncbi:hypothetical protein J3R82DRAFT_1902 [Butyriboletus roseoflavus]|nr:hypothetical protein J3R82DRAFT_1902 [Butyriboletus roseoflavus]